MNENEKVNYVKALMYIALADDTIDEGEEGYLDQIGTLYGIGGVELRAIKSSLINKSEKIEDILATITNRSTQLTLIYDLLAICYADDQYSVIEKQGMQDICDIMHIEHEKLRALEAAMDEQVELQKKINTLLER